MTTANELINDAFDLLEIKSAEVELEDDEINTAIRRMNRMITSWAQEGMNLGYSKVTLKTETVTIPDWSEEAVVALLAVRLAPAFGVPLTQALQAQAAGSLKNLQQQLITIGDVQFPSNLPIGSGNAYRNDQNFYADSKTNTLTTNAKGELTDGESVDLSTE